MIYGKNLDRLLVSVHKFESVFEVKMLLFTFVYMKLGGFDLTFKTYIYSRSRE